MRRSEPRSAKINFENNHPEVPDGMTGVTFANDTQGNIFAYVGATETASGEQVLASVAFMNSEITTGTDVTTNRYIVPFNWDIGSVKIVAKTGPSGGDFEADILFSTNEGGAWTSIFSGAQRATIANGDYSGEETTFADDTIPENAWLRIDVDGVFGAAGVTIEIVGTAA